MRVWRIFEHRAAWACQPDADPLDGSGGLFAAARWHHLGIRMVYTAASPSLAVLEMLVHLDPTLFGERTLLELEVPETSVASVSEQTLLQLLRNALADEAEEATRRYGSAWANERRSLVLEVPSLVMPIERNYLLNPLHPEMAAVGVLRRELVTLDPRLYLRRADGE
ncbi:MAG: RES family NAD+ phosphorylase [Deinococcota bacterium]|nr:RES family NAD+ phosphorylase [Deinococcota bacterium]